MEEIKIEQLSSEQIDSLGVHGWPVWEKEESSFPWTYEDRERCLILAGVVRINPEHGEPVEIQTGDFVTFPKGMNCHWTVKQAVRKHYDFG